MALKRAADADHVGGGVHTNYAPVFRARKKLRTFTEQDAKLAKIYDELASDTLETRLKAVTELIDHCATIKAEVSSDGTLPEHSPADWHKIYVRLIRGLCSSRKSARIGFSLALTELLRLDSPSQKPNTHEFHSERIREVLVLIEKHTQPESGASGQEKRDCLIGRVFAYSSLLQSKVLFHNAADPSDLSRVLEAVCTLSRQVPWPWLKEECGLVCYQAVNILCESKARVESAEEVLKMLQANDFLKSPAGVAIWLEISSQMPSVQFPASVWYKNDPLCGKETAALAKSLHSVTFEDGEATGTRQSSPHFAWDIVLRRLIHREQNSKAHSSKAQTGFKSLKHFWTEAVDNLFFADAASSEKKAVGFQFFQKFISSAPAPALALTFSPKLLKCLINQSAGSGRYLHVAATGLLDTMVSRAQSDQDAAPVIFSALISGNGNLVFDRLTKSKTMHNILITATPDTFCSMLDKYMDIIKRPGASKEQAAELTRQVIADQLVACVREKTLSGPNDHGLDSQWLSSIFTLFIRCGYLRLNIQGDNTWSMPLSTKSQDMFRGRLMSCLTSAIDIKSKDAFRQLPTLVDLFGKFPLTDIIALSKADQAMCRSVERAQDRVRQLKNHSDSAAQNVQLIIPSRDQALILLLCMALLQAYGGEPDAVNMLDELEISNHHLVSREANSRTQAYNTIIEIMLTFSSQTSALNRRIIEYAFSAFAADLTSEGLQSMLDVLSQKEGLAGQEALFDQDVGDGEVENASSEDDVTSEISKNDEDDDDVEVVDQEASSSDAENNSDSSSVVSAASKDSSTELADFENKLAMALRLSRSSTSPHPPSDTSSDSSMDDDQMLALDSTISAMFRHRLPAASTSTTNPHAPTTKKSTHRAAKQTILAFKNRVLDLLALYLKPHHASPLSLATVLPLLRLIRTSRSAQLAGKAAALLTETYFPAAKKRGLPLPEEIEGGQVEKELLEKFREVLAETVRFASKEHARAGSRCCLFLARCAMAVERRVGGGGGGTGKDVRGQIAALYGKAREEVAGRELLEWQEKVWTEWAEFERLTAGVDVDGGKSEIEGRAEAAGDAVKKERTKEKVMEKRSAEEDGSHMEEETGTTQEKTKGEKKEMRKKKKGGARNEALQRA